MTHFEAACLERAAMFCSFFVRPSDVPGVASLGDPSRSPTFGGAGRGRRWRVRVSLEYI